MPSISSLISYILFAEDTTGLYNSPSLDDLFLTVNNEIDKLNTWFSTNKLLINVTKTNFVLFMTQQKQLHLNLQTQHNLNINSLSIKRKDEVKFLDILLNKNLNFKTHHNGKFV